MSSQSLKYGHIIRIKSNDNRTRSYVTSKSYTDPKLYFQTYGFQDNQTKIDVSNYRQSLFEILPTSSFQINDQMNAIKNEAKKAESIPRAKTEQQQFKTIIQQKKGKPIFFGDKVVFRHLDSKHYVYGSFECAQSGIGAFKIDLRQQLSEKLIFQLLSYRTYQKDGDQISIDAPLKIYHTETQCYLSFCMQEIFIDRLTEKEREIDQEKQLYNTFLTPELRLFHRIKKDDRWDDNYDRESEGNKQGSDKKGREQLDIIDESSRYQIINQNIAKRIWKFQPYLDIQLKTNKEVIRDHDIVYLLHTKDDKYLAPNNFNKEINLNKRINALDPDSIFDGLWQIQQRQDILEEEGLNRSKMPTRKTGGLLSATYNGALSVNMSFRKTTIIKKEGDHESEVKKKKSYSLRHLMSGRILYFTQRKNQNFTIELIHNQELFQRGLGERHGFVMLQCLDSNLIDGTLTRLSIDGGKSYLQVKSKQQKKLIKDKLDQSHEVQKQDQLGKLTIGSESQVQKNYESNFQRQDLSPTKDSSEHGFRIYKTDENIKEIALKIMSSQQILYKFTDFICEYRSDVHDKVLNMSLLNDVINVIKDLVGFIFGCQYSKIVSSGNSPNFLRQRAFDELGMVELITSLLNEIQKKDKVLKKIESKSSQYRKIRTIYVLGYEVLQSMATYNNMLKIKISKYLPIYLNHILQPENRVVYKSIQQIIDGNQLALEEQVKVTYINDLIRTFGQEDTTTDPADLVFLSKLCICKNRTVKKNQDAVFLAFYRDNTNENNKFLFKADHGKYQIASKISKKQNIRLRTLPQLYLQCQMSEMDKMIDPSKGHWNYFMQYLNLLADVCVGRNSTPLQYISDNLPLRTLVEFLQQKIIRNQLLYQPFIRLIHHAFVEYQTYKQISRITKVKDWNSLGDKKQISLTSTKIPVQLQQTLKLIKSYIKRINKEPWRETNQKKIDEEEPTSIVFNPEDMASLNSVNTFLQILKSTLILGFWPDMDSIKQIVPYMLKILAFDIEYAEVIENRAKTNNEFIFISETDFKTKVYSKVKQELRLNKPNIVLLVQCKILAAQILDIIIDYEFNIRVSSITSYFRKVQEQNLDLKNYPYDETKFKEKWKDNKEFHLFCPADEKQGYLMNQQLWIDQIKETIQNGNVFRWCNAGGNNINYLLVLFQSFIYGNQNLTDLIFKILIRVTSERKGILNTFKQIILVAGGNLNKLTQRVLKTRSALLKLTNQQVVNEPFKSVNLWNKVSVLDATSEKKQLGTVQQLAFLTIAMKKGSNPTQLKASKFYQSTDLYPFKQFNFEQDPKYKDRSFLIITQKEENNSLNQNLIKSQDHHLLILSFIKLTQKISQNNQDFFMVALHASYNFLTVLVWNNIQNKNELQPFLVEAENHLCVNVGCIDFFQEMYKNNKKLVIKTDVTRIVNKIIQLANDLDLCSYYHKSKLLDFLRNIIIFDNKGISKNQNIVMQIISQYQVSDNNQIVYLNANSSKDNFSLSIDKELDFWVQQYKKDYYQTLDNYKDLKVTPQLFYLATFFQIFSGLIENENKVNIGKCTNMHPHSFLINMISRVRTCWPVIRHLRSYVNKLYYLGDQKETQLMIDFLKTDLQNIKEEMRDIITLIANSPDYNTIKIQNGIRYKYLGSYIYLALQQCLHSLSLMFQDSYFRKFLSIQLGQEKAQDPKEYKLLFILEMVEYLMKTIDGRYINKYLAKVSKFIRDAVAETPLRTVQKYMEIQKNKTAANMRDHHFSADQVMYRKNYIFHDNKGFWRHLIDWNAYYHQQLQRDKAISALSKKTDKQIGGGGGPDAQEKKKRDNLLEKIALGNIQKLILRRDPQKRLDNQKDKEEKNEDEFGNKQQSFEQQGEDLLPKNLMTSLSQRFKVKNQRFDHPQIKNMVINSRRKKLVKFIEVNPVFSQFAREQTKNVLYTGFSSLKDISEKKYGIEVVGKSDVIKTLVEMNKKNPKSIKIEYKVELIKMLTAYIQKESSIFEKDIEEWQISDEEQRLKIQEAQDFLNDCNCSQFLCSLFENDMNTSIEYNNQIILFGICLLVGKNQKVKKKILQILKKDEKNTILIQLGELIKKNQLNIQLFNNFSNKDSEKSEIIFSDTYDFYNDNQKMMERKFTYIPETVLEQKQLQERMIFLQRIFIFLKVLCQGSNQEMKNYIRQQTMNDQQKKVKTESINFIGLSAGELKKLFSIFKIEVIKVSYAIVDFIYEVTQIPCVNNQLFLCKNTSYFHDFAQLQQMTLSKIQENAISKQEIRLLSQFFSRNVRNCISCLQGNHEQIRLSLIADDLPSYYVSTFVLFINELSEQQNWNFTTVQELQERMKKENIFKGKILNLFDITTVIVKLKSKYKKFQDHIKSYFDKANKRKYFQLFEKQLLGIQINMDKGQADTDQTQIQYFPRHSVFNYLSRATRSTIMQQINRSTQRDKLIGLINTTPIIQQQIDYNFILDQHYEILGFPVSISATKIQIYQNIALIFSILICLLMVLWVNVVYYPYDQAIQYDLGSYAPIIKILSTIQFIFALIYTTLWMINHIKLARGKYDLEVDNEKKKSDTSKQPSILQHLFKLPGIKTLYCLALYDTQFSGIVLFIVGSTLGNLYKLQWFSMLIMSIMMSYIDVLKNMIASITTKIKILRMLSLLGMSFIGIFSIFSINFYVESLYQQEIPREHCQTVFRCIVELYIKEQINSEMQTFKFGRFFSDMVYTIFMDLLFGNIISGVLIDTFTELREKRQEIVKDKEGMCFICGITKQILQKKNQKIKTHYRFHYHKLWNYVFYIYNLNLKRQKVGLEYIISQMIKNEDVSWIPVEGEDEEDIGEKIQQLVNAIDEQKKFIEDIEVGGN